MLVNVFIVFSLDDLDSSIAFEAIYCQDKSVRNRVECCLNIEFDLKVFYELIVKRDRRLIGLNLI